MNSIENDMVGLKDMFAIYLTREVNMFSGREMAGCKKMLNDLREIGKLNANEERLMDSNARHGWLARRIEISDEITRAKLT